MLKYSYDLYEHIVVPYFPFDIYLEEQITILNHFNSLNNFVFHFSISFWQAVKVYFYIAFTHKKTAHTHTRLMALFPGLPRWAGTRKVKPI